MTSLITPVLVSSPADACGDKLLVLGRPLRFNSRPAAILAFAPAGSFLETFLNDPAWASASVKGKHKLRVVQTQEQLAENLKIELYDIIVADSGHAPALRSQLATSPSTAVFAPVVERGSRDAQRAAEKEYGIALKGTGKSGDHLFAIGRAVDLHDRKVEAAARGKKDVRKSS